MAVLILCFGDANDCDSWSERNVWNGFHQHPSVAGDVGDRCRGLDGGLTKEVQEELGILAISLKQRAVDYLGTARRSVCAGCFAALSCLLEYQGDCEE
jgi:hypothetical protein